MARADALNLLYSQQKGSSFNFDLLRGPDVLSLLSPYDVNQIWDINNDPRLNTKLKERLTMIDSIMRARGFSRMTQGTNRAVYKYYEDQSFVFKVAISVPGFQDSYKEFYNQNYLKPFVTKCFNVSYNNMIGSFERVSDITSPEQFRSIADDVFTLLNDHIIGKYVMADIGTKHFRNYGLRLGFGPVLLDYPMLFEVDGNKLFCNSVDPYTGIVCDGQIDYDAGFNALYCEKCGRKYHAKELEKKTKTGEIIKKSLLPPYSAERRMNKMHIVISDGENVLEEINNGITSSNIYVEKESKKDTPSGIIITDGDTILETVTPNSKEVSDDKLDEETVEMEEQKLDKEDSDDDAGNDIKEDAALDAEEDPDDDAEDEEVEEPEPRVDASDEVLTKYLELERDNALTFVAEAYQEAINRNSIGFDMYFRLFDQCQDSAIEALETKTVPESFINVDEKKDQDVELKDESKEFEFDAPQSPEELKNVMEGKAKEVDEKYKGMEEF